jgi:putative membrane protein
VRGPAHVASASCLGLLLFSGHVVAHTAVTAGQQTNGNVVELMEVGLPILTAAVLYCIGLMRLHSAARPGRRVFGRALAFAGGLGVLCIALLSPLDAWSAELFAAHMVQHELLMLAAAPLLVLGRPLPIFLWAFSGAWRNALATWSRSGLVRRCWQGLVSAGTAWALHALALWIWHVPPFFNAAVLNRGIHDMQHLTFLLTALVFWAALFDERRRERQGVAILYLFTTTVHTSILGALITFAGHPWYASYLQMSTQWHLTALEDQQLGGLIMWVPGSLVYVGAALVLLARWIAAPPVLAYEVSIGVPRSVTQQGRDDDHPN